MLMDFQRDRAVASKHQLLCINKIGVLINDDKLNRKSQTNAMEFYKNKLHISRPLTYNLNCNSCGRRQRKGFERNHIESELNTQFSKRISF